ncbi:MAG: PIN domain nuclease [Myxococcales bacterium]|nr:PIN domain nuclease [Myxococcales bacterium]
MGRQAPRGLTFDSGALVAFENRDRRMDVLVQRAKDLGRPIVIPAGVLAQVWRGRGPRQARLALLLGSERVSIHDLTRNRAEAVGQLCGRSGTIDVVDASVVVAAWTNGRVVVTSDQDDIRLLDPSLTVIPV